MPEADVGKTHIRRKVKKVLNSQTINFHYFFMTLSIFQNFILFYVPGTKIIQFKFHDFLRIFKEVQPLLP